MKKIITATLFAAAASAAFPAANDSVVKPSIKVSAEARMDYNYTAIDKHTDNSGSGFNANSVSLLLDGNLNRHFSYAFKHRFDKSVKDGNFLDATSWINLTYRPDDHWSFTAGKQVVAIGGFEYDRNPSDVYFASVFWNNIACYQLGVNARYDFSPADAVFFQVVQSPFHTSLERNMYAYNLQWNGNHGIWHTQYSLNLSQYHTGHYISYISLGNRFTIDRFNLELDLMNRAARHQTFFFKDCSIMADAAYRATDWLRPFAKFTYDVNKENYADLTVVPGTELKTIGAGIEGWPLLKDNMQVKVFAAACYSWGKNGAPEALMCNKRFWLDIGVKWSMTIFDSTRRK